MSLVDERGSAEIPRRGRALSCILGVALMGFFLLPLMMAGCGDQGGEKASPPEPATTRRRLRRRRRPRRALARPPTISPWRWCSGSRPSPSDRPTREGPPEPLPAELEFISRRGGKWVKTTLTDPDSNVFHKAMVYDEPDGPTALLTLRRHRALVKLWTTTDGGLAPRTLWEKDFGGKFCRMRDAEIARHLRRRQSRDRRGDPRPGRGRGDRAPRPTAATRSRSSTTRRTPSCTRSSSAT